MRAWICSNCSPGTERCGSCRPIWNLYQQGGVRRDLRDNPQNEAHLLAIVLRRPRSVDMMNDTPPIDDAADTYALASAERLRDMARRVRLISELAVSDRTRRVLQAMAQQYDVLAARLDSREAHDSEQ